MSAAGKLLEELRDGVACARRRYAGSDVDVLHMCEAFRQLDGLLRSGAALPELWKMRDVRQASCLDLLQAVVATAPQTEEVLRRDCIPLPSSYCAMCDASLESETHRKECEGK